MSRFDGLESFASVVDLGGFNAAARHLGVSAAHVSRQVAALEKKLGARLLERTTRSVRLTEAGQLAHARARLLLDQAEELVDEIGDQQSGLNGFMRIAAGGAFGEQVIAPAIVRFVEAHPTLRVELIISDRRMDLVTEGVDLAVRLGALDDTALIARKLTDRRMVLCAAPGYLENHSELRSVDDLAQHSVLESPGIPWRLMTPGGVRTISPPARFASNNIPTLVDAALRGLGLAWLAETHVREHLAAKRLVEILPESRVEPATVWLVYPTRQYLPRRVRAVMDWLVAELGQ
jgi:DNA-binding transcriptional LysR family regulator